MTLDEAVNELIRRGQESPPEGRYRLRSYDMGLKIDVSNIAEALEQLEGPQHR
jgi:hypothetical protein